ncbi:MAG TPA: LemA family protein [Paraburkholderia sp.]|jgi:hypothetical protein|nr:LemA family protein [Paraburkholderia sp.]
MKWLILGCAIGLACSSAGYGEHLAPLDEIRIQTAFDDVLDSYRYRASLVTPLEAALHCETSRPGRRRGSKPDECPTQAFGKLKTAVAAAAANAEVTAERADMPDNAEAFHRFEAAESRLSDTLATLLAAIDHDRALSANPDVARLRVQFAVAADDILEARQKYDEAAGRYGRALANCPADIPARCSPAHPLPVFGLPDRAPEPLRARTDFGVLRGTMRV